jgi:carbon-monoxide dehydrogenase medium subunit
VAHHFSKETPVKPAPFRYFAPDSLDSALELAAQYGSEAKWLAGGQSLVPAMNFRLVQPAVLLDLNRVEALSYVRSSADGGLCIGAMTRQRRVERDPLVARCCPLLAEAMPFVAHPQIRNRGTVGGSLVHSDPAAELPVVAVALDALFEIRSVRGERRVPASDFFQGLFTVDLTPDELLLAVEFPPWPARSGYSFQEVARRHGDYALVGAAALVVLDEAGVCEDARLVFLNVGDYPMSAQRAAAMLRGQRLTADLIENAVKLAAEEEIDPVGDIHATVSYQRHLARVLGRRCLQQAAERAAATTEGR